MTGLPLAAEEFLTWLAVEKGRAPNTLAAYRRDLLAYVAILGGTPLGEAGDEDVARFVAVLRGEGKKPASVARATVAVRSLHRFLAAEEGAPMPDVEVPRVPRSLPKPLSEDEVERLLGAVVGDDPLRCRDRALLELLYATGCRISELCGLDLGHLDLVRRAVRLYGKGDKERLVPVGRQACAALDAWLGPAGRPQVAPRQWARRGDAAAVFLNARGGRLSRSGAWRIVQGYAERAGLGDRVHPHVLRHTAATHLLDHGADVRVVQEFLGHASIATTQVYTLVSSERLWQIYDATHPRARSSR